MANLVQQELVGNVPLIWTSPNRDHTVTLQCVRPNAAYTVTVYRHGYYRVDDLCGSYPNEFEARAVARLLAQIFAREDAAPKLEDIL